MRNVPSCASATSETSCSFPDAHDASWVPVYSSDSTRWQRRKVPVRLLLTLFCLLPLNIPVHSAQRSSGIRHVIVIAMENKDAFEAKAREHSSIYGNKSDAPYVPPSAMKP